jgi:hypothetical protein
VTDWWLLEVCVITLASLSLAGLIITLIVYHNKAIPHWRWGLTLNSLLSILSQIITLSVSVTKVLAGALIQQKWLWFRNSRRSLNDFERFDDGPWASLKLMFSRTTFG